MDDRPNQRGRFSPAGIPSGSNFWDFGSKGLKCCCLKYWGSLCTQQIMQGHGISRCQSCMYALMTLEEDAQNANDPRPDWLRVCDVPCQCGKGDYNYSHDIAPHGRRDAVRIMGVSALSEPVRLELTPGIHNAVLNPRMASSRTNRKVIGRELDLAFAEGDRPSQLLLADGYPSRGSQFFNSALSNTMTS